MTALSTAVTSDEDFLSRLKQFQPDAWDELYDTYFPKMYRYLYLHTGDRDAAEELAAEVFEQACKRVQGFRYRGVPISSWLYRVAHNRMVDWLRHRSRAATVPVGDDLPEADQLARVAQREELRRALSRLTSEQREVLVLRHIEGHSAASAGQVMGKNGNAVRALEFRALASLRRIMNIEKWGETR